jgi:hypothetical protein
MPESTTPPPKHGSSSAFIGAVILMLLAMGGLLYWKFSSKETPTAQLPIPSATATPVLEEAPPPPPPIEPDAGKVQEPVKKKVVASGGGGCGTCSGEVPPQLRSALASAANSARGCYERALRQNAMLQGKMLVSVKVGTQGNSCSANMVSDTLGDPSVATCVLQKFRGGSFPAPKGGCAEVNVPISFIPKTAK